MDKSDVETIRRYWDARAIGYAEATLRDIELEEVARWDGILKKALSRCVGEIKQILDVGCGPGFFSLQLSKLVPQAQITAVDLSEKMLEQLNRTIDQRGLKNCIHTVCSDAETIEGRFDLIVSRNLLWNLPDPVRAIKIWKKALNPQGAIFIADGNHYRYQTQEDYRRILQAQQQPKSHEPKYLQDVDPRVMEEVATRLPLSNCDRPQWDEQVLRSLGFEHIERLSQTVVPVPGSSRSCITDFVVLAY